jgi:signal transduction histidine kinase
VTLLQRTVERLQAHPLLDWFIPSSLMGDAESHRHARMFVSAHFAGALLGPVVLLYLFYGVDPMPGAHRTALFCGGLAFAIYPVLLRVTRQLLALTLLSTEHFILLILFACYHYGGALSFFMQWLVMVPLLVFFYVGPRPVLRLLVLLAFVLQIIAFYFVKAQEIPEHIPLDSLTGVATVSALLASAYVAVTSFFFTIVVGAQQRQLQAEIGNRRQAEMALLHSQRLESLGTLAGGVAHELNNALVPVIALTKIVARNAPALGRDRANLDIVLKGAERARDLVTQILAFSRKEGPRREKVDLSEVLRQALQMLRASVPANIRFEEAIASTPLIDGDPGQLHQVVVNLVTNAAHAIGHAPGKITVGLEPKGTDRRIYLSVADTGTGMDDTTRARIFEPFFTTKDVGQGTGLGLSVVHGIVTSHHGSIDVESAPGRGTRFTVVLPMPVDADAAA